MFHKKAAKGSNRWRCAKGSYQCAGRVFVGEDDETIVTPPNEHTCGLPNPVKRLQVEVRAFF